MRHFITRTGRAHRFAGIACSGVFLSGLVLTLARSPRASVPKPVLLSGHAGVAIALAFSPDARLLASGGEDKTVRIWDLARVVLSRTLAGHARKVWGVSFTPDGAIVASGSADNTVKLWEVATGRELRSFRGRGDVIIDVAIEPKGERLAAVEVEELGHQGVRLWSISAGKDLGFMEGHAVNHPAAYSPDGRFIACGSMDEWVNMWDLATKKWQGFRTGHLFAVNALAYSPEGGWLATGSGDGTIKVWLPGNPQPVRTLTGNPEQRVLALAFSSKGKWIAAAGDKALRLWNVSNGRELLTLEDGLDFASVAISSDGRWLAAGSSDNKVRLWDLTQFPS